MEGLSCSVPLQRDGLWQIIGKKMYQINAELISKKQISEKYFLLTFLAEAIAKNALPGQFVMLKIDDDKTFLRRPFGICSVDGKTFDIVFNVVGIGTEILSQKKPGDVLNILGPMGNGYPHPPSTIHHPLSVILVAGGTGVASLLFFAKRFTIYDLRFTIFLGAKTKRDILFESEFRKLGHKVIVSTEDGSYGSKGFVSDVFSRFLSTYQLINLPTAVKNPRTQEPKNPRTPFITFTAVYSCGPKPMLKAVAKISKKHNLKCFVSLEEKMACGVGACMGCMIKTITNYELRGVLGFSSSCPACGIGFSEKTFKFLYNKLQITNKTSKKSNSQLQTLNPQLTYKRVCKDGPVFDAEEIVW